MGARQKLGENMNNIIKLTLAALCAVGIWGSASAQLSDDGSGTVTIAAALTLAETTPMSWGTVAAPGDGTADYTLNYATGAVTLTASTSTTFPGYSWDNGAAGLWALAGDANANVSFSVSIGAFDGTGVTVLASHINGTSASGTGTLDGSGDLDLNLGGIIRVAANATLGLHTSVVTVTADYD